MKPQPGPLSTRRARSAFSLLEVLIAIGIFFIAIFAILDLTSRSLKTARVLQSPRVDASGLAGLLSLTNRLEEGVDSGNFDEPYADYSWSSQTLMIATNGLFQVGFIVSHDGNPQGTRSSILLFRPLSTK